MNKAEIELTTMIPDIVKHPSNDLSYINSIFDRKDFTESSISSIKKAFSTIMNNNKLSEAEKADYLLNSWKILYKAKPPSMKEFLTTKYLGSIADSVRPYVKDWLIDFYDFDNYKFVLSLYTAIRLGKSFAVVIATLYTLYVTHLMRDAKQYYGLNKSSSPSICYASFSIEKTIQVLGDKLLNFLYANDSLYVQAKRLDQVNKLNREVSSERMVWTKAKEFTFLSTDSMQIIVTSSPNKLLGIDFLFGVISEINFFGEAGKNPEEGMKLITELTGRIKGTVPQYKSMYYPRIFIDSSPYDMELNPVDSYMMNEAPNNSEWKVIRGSRWDYQPEVFPIYHKDGITFPVFRGTGSRGPKILEQEEVKDFEEDEIIDVPIDLQDHFKNNLLSKVIQDWAGYPTGGSDSLIGSKDSIETMFTNTLSNIYGYIYAPADLPPENLIWDQIKDKFFIKIHDNLYEFYRNPHAVRFISVDQSIVNDWTGISCCHIEKNIQGQLMYIIDFTISIIPGLKKVNLEAIKYFINDLRKYGKLNIHTVSFDQFQSASTMQYLKLRSFNVEKLSVDISTEPYLNFISAMQRGCVRVGKSIVLKNNLKSLIMSKTKGGKKKVDHIIGDSFFDLSQGDWETCKVGRNSKDTSDSTVACVALADTYGSKNPTYVWKDLDNNSDSMIQLKSNFLEGIGKKYKLGVG